MAQTNRRGDGIGDAREVASARRVYSPQAPEIAPDGAERAEALRATIDMVFRNDDAAANAFKENLKTRTLASGAIAERAEKAFRDFSASSRSEDERSERSYLSDTDDLAKTLDAVAKDGARALKRADANRGIRLTRSRALDDLLKSKHGDHAATIGTVGLNDLLDYVTERLGTSTSFRPSPRPEESSVVCSFEEEAEQRLGKIESPPEAPPEPDPLDAPIADAALAAATSENGSQSAQAFVEGKVELLMDTVVSPEHPIRIDPGDRVDEKAIRGHIATFELRDGPSDVTSYHDFNSLQIAFQHVWTEVFDGELESLGRELYKEYVRLKDFAGLDDGKDKPISTVEDLAGLIGEVKELSRLTQDEIPGTLTTGRDGTSRDVPVGTRDFRDNPGYKALTGGFIEDDAARFVANPLGFGIDVVADLLADASQITWDILEDGRLPGGVDVIDTKIEEEAAPAGMVEIVLATSESAATWKGIDFTELDSSGRPLDSVKISNNPGDFDKMRLAKDRVKNGMLRFGKEITFGSHKAQYFLVDLDDRLTDRTRVTFTWEKDKGW